MRFWLCPYRNAQVRLCTVLAAESRGRLALPLGTAASASHVRAARGRYRPVCAPHGRRGASVCHLQASHDAMHDCKQCFSGGTSSALLHVHPQMCLQPWTLPACSRGPLSGAALQPAGLNTCSAAACGCLIGGAAAAPAQAAHSQGTSVGCASVALSCVTLHCKSIAQRMRGWQKIHRFHTELLASAGVSASRRGKHGSRDRSGSYVRSGVTQRECPDRLFM